MMILYKYRRIIAYLFIATVISFLIISLISEWRFKIENGQLMELFSYRNNSEIQLQRRERIQRACTNQANDSAYRSLQMMITLGLNPLDFHALHYDDDNKIIYCEVPKVACSNWKRVLLMLSGKVKANNLSDIPVNEVHSKLSKRYLKRMSELTLPEISKRLNSSSGYFKFVFVREPHERLLSAYRNKFMAPYSLYFQKRFGRYIVNHIRLGNKSNESLMRGHDVTFPEFIRFITKKDITEFGKTANAHWRPVSELCLPCLVDYNFIGKYETMDDGDVEYVLNRLNIKHLSFPPAYGRGANRTSNLLVKHYREVPHVDIVKVKDLFNMDFQMFYPGNSSDIR